MIETHEQVQAKQSVWQKDKLTLFMGLGILFLAAANGIFTFSGAQLYLDTILYALLFAVAVQLAISITLLALPYIKGFGRIVLLLVYVAALVLSTLSAYTYIYNASLPEGKQTYAIDTAMKAHIAEQLGLVMRAEKSYLDGEQARIAEIKRSAEEEALRGNVSGKGPGRGAEYYAKIEDYDKAKTALQGPLDNYAQLEKVQQEVLQGLRLAGNNQREALILLISRMNALSNTVQAQQMLSILNERDLGKLKNPVERAIAPLLETGGWSVMVFVSLIWAAVFDLLALFLGIIRYYLVRENVEPVLDRVYESIVKLFSFFFRLFHIRDEARRRYQQNNISQAQDLPLNSVEIQNFAAYLIAGSEMASEKDDDSAEPLRRLITHIEPLHLDCEEHKENDLETKHAAQERDNLVGIKHDVLQQEPRLKPLMAMLLQNRVFLNQAAEKCYLLNPSAEMTQKVLIFLRLGMKEQAELLEKLTFLPPQQPMQLTAA